MEEGHELNKDRDRLTVEEVMTFESCKWMDKQMAESFVEALAVFSQIVCKCYAKQHRQKKTTKVIYLNAEEDQPQSTSRAA